MHARATLREIHGGLSSRVAGTDDRHFLTGAQLRLHERRGVIHARSLESREIADLQAPILSPGSDNHGARAETLSVLHFERVRCDVTIDSLHVASDHQLGTKFLRLTGRTRREFRTGDPCRKA